MVAVLRAVVALAFAAGASSAVVRVVDPSGDDSASGTVSEPWRTIELALTRVTSGDVVLLRGGVYSVFNQGGVAGLRGWSPVEPGVTLAAYPGETPIVDYDGISFEPNAPAIRLDTDDDGFRMSGITFRAWVHALGSGSNSEHVRVDGTDALEIESCTWDSCGADFGTVTVTSAAGGSHDVTIADCAFTRNADDWRASIVLHGDGNPGTDEIFTVRDGLFNDVRDLALPEGGRPAVRVFSVDSLVVEGCFGYNAGGIRTPTTDESDFIHLTSTTRATIRGCEMRRYVGDWQFEGEDHPLHQCDGVVLWDGCSDVRIEDCLFWGAGHGVEVLLGSHDFTIERVYTDSTYDDGIYVDATSHHGVISGCVIHHPWDNGIDLKGQFVDVRHNTLVRCYSNALSVWGTCESVKVLDNCVYDLLAGPASFFGNEGSTFDQADGVAWDYNLYFSPDADEVWFQVCDPVCRAVVWSDWTGAWAHDANGHFDDPLFVDPDGRGYPLGSTSFMLGEGSPGRDAASDGLDVGAIQRPVTGVGPGSGQHPVLSLALRTRNPFTTGIAFEVLGQGTGPEARGALVIDVIDVSGRVVRRLVRGAAADAGLVWWDGTDDGGRTVASGVYVVRATVDTRVRSRRVVRLR